MKRTSLILIASLAIMMLPAAFGQSKSSPSQDPNTPAQPTPSMQQPEQPGQSPATSNPTSSSSSSDAQRSFAGSITKSSGKYVLHTGGSDYQLDDQAQASKFEGKNVKVTGQLDQSSNTIRVQSIEPSGSM